MGPLIRNFARYGLGASLGWLVGKGFIPQELADQLNADPEVFASVQLALTLAGGAVVEFVYSIAKRRGWAT